MIKICKQSLIICTIFLAKPKLFSVKSYEIFPNFKLSYAFQIIINYLIFLWII